MVLYRPAGIHCVLYAMFERNERIDDGLMRAQLEAVLAARVDGVTILGLATEANKLSAAERIGLMRRVASDLRGRAPLSVTISGNSVAEQVAQLEAAQDCGADWLILQPPAAGAVPASEYIAFFGRVADASRLPVAIQNAPAYFGRGLTTAELRELTERHPSICILKGEGPAADIAELIRTLGRDIPVLNGRGGLEMTDSFRAGCAGLILAPDLVDRAVRCFNAYSSGNEPEAERIYAASLPAIVFIMQSLESLVVYGKRLFAARAGLGEVHDRRPAISPTDFGLAIVKRLANRLGPFGSLEDYS